MSAAEEQDREALALFSIVGRAQGLHGVAGFDFPLAQDSIDTLATAVHLPAAQRLEVLAQAVRAVADTGSALRGADLNDFAESFVRRSISGTAARSKARDDLLTRLSLSQPGLDPLGRDRPAELLHPDMIVATLTEEVQDTSLSLFPNCSSSTIVSAGYLTLSIRTKSITRKSFNGFRTIVDPCQWPNCWLEQRFFRSMKFVRPPGGPPGVPVPPPDHGWSGALEEVVDWSLGLGQPDLMKTELDFVYVWPEVNSAERYQRGASTYDLVRSIDGRVTVDQGYLLAEDLLPAYNLRRLQTLKQVHLTHGPAVSKEVCLFWSIASGLIQQGC